MLLGFTLCLLARTGQCADITAALESDLELRLLHGRLEALATNSDLIFKGEAFATMRITNRAFTVAWRHLSPGSIWPAILPPLRSTRAAQSRQNHYQNAWRPRVPPVGVRTRPEQGREVNDCAGKSTRIGKVSGNCQVINAIIEQFYPVLECARC